MKQVYINNSPFDSNCSPTQDKYKWSWSFNKKSTDNSITKFDIFIVFCVFLIAYFIMF